MTTLTYRKLLKACGGQQKDIATALGISKPAVSQWQGVIPLSQAEAVEQFTGGLITIGEIVRDWNRAKSKQSGSNSLGASA